MTPERIAEIKAALASDSSPSAGRHDLLMELLTAYEQAEAARDRLEHVMARLKPHTVESVTALEQERDRLREKLAAVTELGLSAVKYANKDGGVSMSYLTELIAAARAKATEV